MSEYPIRGGLGTQIMSIFAVYAHAIEHNNTVDKIWHNGGGYGPITKDTNIMFYEDVLKFKNTPKFEMIDGRNKTSAFREPYTSLILKHWYKILDNVYAPGKGQNHKNIIHIRQLDRAFVNQEQWAFLKNKFPDYEIIGDEEENANDTVEDWHTIFGANQVIGSYSAYTLSAAMLNKNLNLKIISPAFCNRSIMDEQSWNAVRKIVFGPSPTFRHFPNIKFIDDKAYGEVI